MTFIELHLLHDGDRTLINVAHIVSLVPRSRGTIVNFSGRDDNNYIIVAEDYADVRAAIIHSQRS